MTLKTPTGDLHEKYLRLKNDSIFYRGFIIDESVVMELVLDDILSNYFCEGEKAIEINNIIFNTEYVALGSKIDMFQSILLKQKFKDFWKNNNTIIQDLHKIRKLRNKLAHLKLQTTDKDIEDYDGETIPYTSTVNGEVRLCPIKPEQKKIDINLIENIIKKLIKFRNEVLPLLPTQESK